MSSGDEYVPEEGEESECDYESENEDESECCSPPVARAKAKRTTVLKPIVNAASAGKRKRSALSGASTSKGRPPAKKPRKGFKAPTIRVKLPAAKRSAASLSSASSSRLPSARRVPVMGRSVKSVAKRSSLDGGDAKRRKFRIPRIVNPEALEKALGKTVEEFQQEFNSAMRRLGIFREKPVRALHDADADDALILYAPNEESANMEEELRNAVSPEPAAMSKRKKKKKVEVHIVVDPKLTKVLRPHQREGVEFVFGCLMGQKHAHGSGCILADDMGLGKTLQSIAVIWTLLTQGVYGKPTCNNGIIVSPASLVKNWDLEIQKWLGSRAIASFVCLSNTKKVIADFLKCHKSRRPVLIISYESYREHVKLITSKPLGFAICDEGHKLKNHKSNLSKSMKLIDTPRRLLLSGTPIQNNLDEMYSLVSFVNPSVWEDYAEFRSFARSIERSFDFSVSEKLKTAGSEATGKVRQILAQFLLQRTNVVVRKYLPKRSEYVVFCRLQPLQQTLYRAFLKSKVAKSVKRAMGQSQTGGGGMNAMGFLACGVLCKICNHPSLIYAASARVAGVQVPDFLKSTSKRTATRRSARSCVTGKSKKTQRTDVDYDESGARIRNELQGLFELFPSDYGSDALNAIHSTKCQFVMKMVRALKSGRSGDKVVVVSVYVETLTVLSKMLEAEGVCHLRLDGSIPTKKRQGYVDRFNDASSEYMVLLLSNRAGGCGLNLIGANRLIMFDPDWNPANDAQAMARVWRSGQRKATFIYRLLSTGSIEEKMFQRQTFKADMAEQLVAEDASDISEFVLKELKAIFEFNETTVCDTLDRLKGSHGFADWVRHGNCTNVGDAVLTRAAANVTFLLKRVINDEKEKAKMRKEEEDAKADDSESESQ